MQGNRNISNLLTILKDEILKQTSTALPLEIRLLDGLLKDKDEDSRLNTLKVRSPLDLTFYCSLNSVSLCVWRLRSLL